MLELKGLKFKCIGRFVEEQSIDFSILSDFIQVDAENHNTGGSSGSGKSTIFNALDYLLGLPETLPSTVLQSRLTKDTMSVTGYFSLDGTPLEITRSKSGLRIDLDGDIKEGSSAIAEEKLDQILGMSRDLFRKLMHKRQKEGGFFLDFTPKKMHEFLADCLDLGEFKKKNELVDKKITELTNKKIRTESDLNVSHAGLKATQDAILALGLAPIKDIHKEVILELKEKMDRSGLRLKDVECTCKENVEKLEKDRPNTTVSRYDGRNRESLESRRSQIGEEISKFAISENNRQSTIKSSIAEKNAERVRIDNQINDGNKAKEEAASIAAQVKQIRANQCPTCEQHWATDSAKTAEQKHLERLTILKQIIVLGSTAEQTKIILDQELDALKSTLTPLINPQEPILNQERNSIDEQIREEKKKADEFLAVQNVANSKLMSEFAAKQTALRQTNEIEINQYRGQADLDRRTFDIAVQKLRAYEEARVRYESSLTSLKSKEENFTKQAAELEKAIVSTDTELLLAEEVRKAVKTYISYSFDDALEIIGDNATKIIRCIPNMSNATIQFEGTKETKDGKVKEEVTAVIGMDGEVGVPIKSLSGGERSAVDLSVDLAVIDFIESKSGKGINVFVLDEPFSGLGTVEIEMALEVLKNSNTNKKLIIVDHNPEIKQMVQSRLVVVRDGITSRIA